MIYVRIPTLASLFYQPSELPCLCCQPATPWRHCENRPIPLDAVFDGSLKRHHYRASVLHALPFLNVFVVQQICAIPKCSCRWLKLFKMILILPQFLWDIVFVLFFVQSVISYPSKITFGGCAVMPVRKQGG